MLCLHITHMTTFVLTIHHFGTPTYFLVVNKYSYSPSPHKLLSGTFTTGPLRIILTHSDEHITICAENMIRVSSTVCGQAWLYDCIAFFLDLCHYFTHSSVYGLKNFQWNPPYSKSFLYVRGYNFITLLQPYYYHYTGNSNSSFF